MDIRQNPRGRSSIWPYLLLLPALIIMVSVVIVPIINAVSMSFQSYNLTRPKKIGFIGLPCFGAPCCERRSGWSSAWAASSCLGSCWPWC